MHIPIWVSVAALSTLSTIAVYKYTLQIRRVKRVTALAVALIFWCISLGLYLSHDLYKQVALINQLPLATTIVWIAWSISLIFLFMGQE